METIELTTTVLPGGRLEVVDSRLHEGDSVQVLLKPMSRVVPPGDDPMDAIMDAPLPPERRSFRTSEELEAYLEEERNAWD
jgi:hypothetical protein